MAGCDAGYYQEGVLFGCLGGIFGLVQG